MKEIKREQKMADHLFYVSLKYTKSGDVILNLIKRWEMVVHHCIFLLLKKSKKKKSITIVPSAPKAKELLVRRYYRDPIVKKVLDYYALFRRMPNLEKIKEHEFRKNVAVRVIDAGKEIEINMEKLKKFYELFNDFVRYCEKVYARK
ncbi:MAG: hypothetical protein JSW08_02680 [archaeon]|nr:MAG: hypothetical protein JSW08_02680 [archaeon]